MLQRNTRRSTWTMLAFSLTVSLLCSACGGGGGSTPAATTTSADGGGEITAAAGGIPGAPSGKSNNGNGGSLAVDTSGGTSSGTTTTGSTTGGTTTTSGSGTTSGGTSGGSTGGSTGGTTGGSTSGGSTTPPTTMPGGFVELATSTVARPVLSTAQIQAFMPTSRGLFTFPAPYNTKGVRITVPGDCNGGDCVEHTGYHYWKNINNHVGSDTMYIFLGMRPSAGGTGPTLFSYNKVTNAVANLGPLFPTSSPFYGITGEMWYFSASMPTKLYIFQNGGGGKLYRYDILTKQLDTVFDIAPTFGSNKYIWQPHSSNDDKIHTVTIRNSSTYAMEGCAAFNENTQQFTYFAAIGDFDECIVDKSGTWVISLENVDGQYAHDNRIWNLQTGAYSVVLDQNGAAAHLDTGYGVMVGEDNWNNLPGAARLYTFGQTPVAGPVVYNTTDWSNDLGHTTFENASNTIPLSQQYACNTHASRNNPARANEVFCFGMNTSKKVLIVAPSMSNLNATGGGSSDYEKIPLGNIDVTGQYLIWTTNMGTSRQDAIIVKVPGHLLNQ